MKSSLEKLDNSVYNHLKDWSNLIHKQKEEMAPTRKVLVEKIIPRYKHWESLGFLEGLKGHVKNNIAQLYESQASCILEESLFKPQTIGISSRAIGEKSKTAVNYQRPNINETKKQSLISKIKYFFISIWQKIFKKKKKKEEVGFPSLLPIATRVAARTIEFDLINVEPLGLPTGMLFYLDMKSQENENVYTSKVLIEKYKPTYKRKYDYNDYVDYFIPTRTSEL